MSSSANLSYSTVYHLYSIWVQMLQMIIKKKKKTKHLYVAYQTECRHQKNKKHESVCLKQKQLSTYRLSNLLSQLLMFVAYVSLSVWWVSGEVHTNSFGFSSVSGYHHIQVCVLTCEWIWVSAAILHLLAANVPKRVLNCESHCKRILGESRWAGVMLRILHAE